MKAPRPTSLRGRGLEFAAERLRQAGFLVEAAPVGVRADLVISKQKQATLVKVLTSAGPHRRGRSSSIGMHWMLTDTPAELVALADPSNSRLWLLPAPDFRRLAQPVSGGRFHLDWMVIRAAKSSSKLADEDYFDAYEI